MMEYFRITIRKSDEHKDCWFSTCFIDNSLPIDFMIDKDYNINLLVNPKDRPIPNRTVIMLKSMISTMFDQML